jgi:hypothetical protein
MANNNDTLNTKIAEIKEKTKQLVSKNEEIQQITNDLQIWNTNTNEGIRVMLIRLTDIFHRLYTETDYNQLKRILRLYSAQFSRIENQLMQMKDKKAGHIAFLNEQLAKLQQLLPPPIGGGKTSKKYSLRKKKYSKKRRNK